MWRFYTVIVIFWLCITPPLFTGGACTDEFEQESSRVNSDAKQLRTPKLAVEYWNGRNVRATLVSQDQCRASKPRFLERCGDGPLVYVGVPVKNTICRFYRDETIKVRLQYNDADRLVKITTDMDPSMSYPIPLSDHLIHWAR